METRQVNEYYADIALDLIRANPSLEHLRDADVTICFLSSDLEKRSKRKTVYAECERVPDKYKWAVPCDFTITVFEPNVERFTADQMAILLCHELMHIGVDVDGNERTYYLAPHDIEDFREIIERYGMDWAL